MNLNNNGNGIIKVEARHEFTLFPRYPIILGKEDNNYGVVKWSVLNALEGEPITDKNDCVTITGSYDEEIDGIKTYTILAKETEHPQHGKQYQLIFIGEILNLSNVGNQKAFLKTFLTNGQIEEMFKVLKNPLEAIQNHDIESLKKVHGIGDYISEAIIMRYEKSKDYCNVYLELDGLGLTPTGITTIKLYKGQFGFYDKQISHTFEGDIKKTVLEKSWFARGNKLLVTGYRRDDQFVPKKYIDSAYRHTLQLIKDIDENGDLILQTERVDIDELE